MTKRNEFDWHVGESEDEELKPVHIEQSRWASGSIWFIIVSAVITTVFVSSWQVGRYQLARSEKKNREAAQNILDDPQFDLIDFFPQIWQGTGWQGRAWFMPQAANMRLLYYDKAAYQRAGLAEPSLRWTWEEMAQDVAILVPAQPDSADLVWGFLDTGLDSLFSYAFNWNNQCAEAATILCQTPMQQRLSIAWFGGDTP